MSQTNIYDGHPSRAYIASGVVLHGGKISDYNNITMLHTTSNYGQRSNMNLVKTKDVTEAATGPLYIFASHNKRPLVKGGTLLINFAAQDHDLFTRGNSAPSLTTNIHIHERYVKTSLRSRAIREGNFSFITGKFTLTYPHESLDDFGLDIAANSTRQNPGKLVFSSQTNKPITKSYSQKNG